MRAYPEELLACHKAVRQAAEAAEEVYERAFGDDDLTASLHADVAVEQGRTSLRIAEHLYAPFLRIFAGGHQKMRAARVALPTADGLD